LKIFLVLRGQNWAQDLRHASALYCYTCNWEQSNWRCLKAEKCSDEDQYCVTNVASVGIGRCCLCIPSQVLRNGL
uniref:Snake toxin/toxin-like domain-containing protein n=1 Tax=Zosterops lateralis melanops TaxID=1220523 RepID=A0A8D2P2X5_ZOSLA